MEKVAWVLHIVRDALQALSKGAMDKEGFKRLIGLLDEVMLADLHDRGLIEILPSKSADELSGMTAVSNNTWSYIA